MAINLTDNIRVGMQKPVDSRYFDVANSGLVPWQSLAAVKNQTTGIPTALRFRGLTVNIQGVEYWWKDGITDPDLVIKSSGTTLTLGTIGSTPNADGATLTSGELKLQPASGTQGGVVTALNQTFGGAKTFIEDLKVNNLTVGEGGAAGSTGLNNTTIGFNALQFNNANNNTAVGHNALSSNVGGYQNTAIGSNALQTNVGEPSNAIPGVSSIGLYNTAVGFEALKLNISNNNTAVGIGTLSSNTMGFQNTAIGSEALKSNTTGEENTAVGKDALKSSIDTNWNTAVGSSALEMNSLGFQNTAVGRFTARLNTSGCYNTAIGVDALTSNLSSNYNTALGYKAGYTVIGLQNTFIGAQDDVVTTFQLDTVQNSTAIGYNAFTTKNNQVVIGNSIISETLLRGDIKLTTPPTTSPASYDILTINTFAGSNTGRIEKISSSSIGSGTFVPYTGATSTVNLGANNLVIGSGGANGANITMQGNTTTSYIKMFNIGQQVVYNASTIVYTSIQYGGTKTLYLSTNAITGNDYSILLPDASGTVALTSDLSGFVTLANPQTITGLKTFTSQIIIDDTTNSVLTFFSSGVTKAEISGNGTFFQFSANNTDGYLFKNSAAANALAITQTGNATFLGSATATGFFNSSDARLKDVIERDGDTVKFTWKDKRDDKIHIGYIAQEVQEKYPDQVNESTDGLLTVNYIEVLVAKIQELENRIKQLEK
jgi:hypothetical protein